MLLDLPRSIPALTIAVFAAAMAAPQENSPTPVVSQSDVPAEIRRLIQQLGDPQRDRREAATARLETLGLETLPLMENELASARGEVAWRLRLLRSRVAERAVAAAIEPTRVAARPPGTPVAEAFETVFQSPGGRIAVDGTIPGETVLSTPSPTSGQSTYWEAIDRLLSAAGLCIEAAEAAPGGLQIRPLSKGQPPPTAAAAGPLRVEVVRAVAVPAEQPRVMRVMLRLIWEPRLKPIMIQLPMVSLVAEGEAGELVPPQQRTAVVEVSPRGSAGWAIVPVLLAAPTTPGASIGSLRGTLDVWVPAGDVDVRLPVENRLQRQTQHLGDAKIRLESVALSPAELRVRTRADYPATEALASHRTWITSRLLRSTIGGQQLTVLSDRVVARDNRGIAREAVFAVPPGSESAATQGEVRWRLPFAIRKFPVEFLLHDIALPYPSDAIGGDSR